AKPRTIALLTGTKDLQMDNITCHVFSCPNITSLSTIHQELGAEYDDRVLPSIASKREPD
ncbi:hypothetical protein BY996DRAFT_4598276, partial [Phakopsora pachyrhizi]